MTTTIDIQLFLDDEDRVDFDEIKKLLPAEFILESKEKSEYKWAISYSDESCLSGSLNEEVFNFASKLIALDWLLKKSNKLLRIGVFYDIKETIVCPMIFEENTVELLAKLKSKIFLTGYLCSDTE
jgi:hypothetical protein